MKGNLFASSELTLEPIVTDRHFFDASSAVYYKEDSPIPKMIELDTEVWEVIRKFEDEHNNGIQIVAFARLENGKVPENPQIVIAHRGTEPFALDGDITADVQQIVMGSSFKLERGTNVQMGPARIHVPRVNEETQFKCALDFAKEIRQTYPTSDIQVTGHSLGGALAQYVAAEMAWKATTFAAPNIYKLLSPEAKKRVDKGEMREKVRDYVHQEDMIGRFRTGDNLIGKEFFVKSNDTSIMGHKLSTYSGKFNGDGSIQFLMMPEDVLRIVRALEDKLEEVRRFRKKLIDFLEEEAEDTDRLYRKMLQEVDGSGKYPLASSSDVKEHFREQAQTVEGNTMYFLDVQEMERVIGQLERFERQMRDFARDLNRAAETSKELDQTMSEWYQ